MRHGLRLIFTYHSISEGPGPLRTAPADLAVQLDWLAAAGFRAVPLGAVASARDDDAPCYALTFDDAYADFAAAALPRLRERGLPATLFVTASSDRSRLPGGLEAPLLSPAAVREVAEAGVEIGAHSIGHADLRELDGDALERELGDARRTLEDWTGRAVESLAYPFGAWTPRLREAADRHYARACTTRMACVLLDDDPMALPRVDAFYLRSGLFRRLLERGRPDPYLTLRHWLRRLRGSERSGAGA